VVLRTVKHMGRLLDWDGHCVGAVPLRRPEGPGTEEPPYPAPQLGPRWPDLTLDADVTLAAEVTGGAR